MTEIEQLLAQVADKARTTRPWGWTSLFEPVDAAAVTRAEAALGFRLPPPLAELYLRIGDGGFGPEYGLLPLLDSPPADEPAAVVQYLANRESARKDPAWPWPEGVLPISHWGCAMYACVDCLDPQAPVLLFEPNADDTDHAWYVDAPSLTAWLRAWVDGTGWYEETNEGADPEPWPDFRRRTTPGSTPTPAPTRTPTSAP
ncbi:SMI1/KNR4 family protein [Streptomyces chromofuscus]|uniref:SMI1/KNR4 family protein n=1 Tax=Streptomyces chromofuscus TaxID=42881 RepID=A0A7M2T132_STRCW|nr:SMI1/KNR4 family protein [Streptomyces chromofuscus]QOV42367.1 SMI1/KNR4 family protein [Streptomyces chromofuscus]GGT27646.1 SMI1/KNR4 family protein [Streptomyces chromofuscus]